MEQLFNLTIKPIFITLEVAAFWFLLTGLQERYFKPWAIGFWGGVERRVLALALDIFDRKAPEVFAQLPSLDHPSAVLSFHITQSIARAASELGIEMGDGQADRLVRRFGELYNPLIGAGKLNPSVPDNGETTAP